jgi:hypothetical protein
VLVQDAAFMVTVPYFCPDVPALKKNPVFLYSSDGFRKPNPFQADIAVAVDDVFDTKVAAIHELPSQAYEGGASGNEELVRSLPPETDPPARKTWLRARWSERQAAEANRFRDVLTRLYGEERGKAVKFAETFELCEYGSRPNADEIRRLFPFFGAD